MKVQQINIDYQKFIEHNFKIKNKDGYVVPFIFGIFQDGQVKSTQDHYMEDLYVTYGPELEGVRDIDLKARKEGFSSQILGIFATDFLIADHPVNSMSIADTKDETRKLFNRAKYFLNSALGQQDKSLEDICEVYNNNEITNKTNGASFWIGTAGSKTAPRVESVQNLHFSEAAHFPDTDIITAQETIEGALQMVNQGTGKVFIESTARGYGNYYQDLWALAEDHQSQFRPVFYSAQDFYSAEWLKEKEKDFTSHEMYLQEYPGTPEEAFKSTGSKFFDTKAINYQQAFLRNPIMQGNMSAGGEFIST